VTYKASTPFGMVGFNVLRNHGSIEWCWLDGTTWHLDYGIWTRDRTIKINGKTAYKGVFTNTASLTPDLEWRDWDSGDRVLTIRDRMRLPRRRLTYRDANATLVGKYFFRCNPMWKPDEFIVKLDEDYLTSMIYADIISRYESLDDN
jgi:hypothetical protein